VKLDSTFTVDAPMNAVWATILDVPTVAPCVPGARVVSQLADDAYQVAVKVKVGPIAMEYRGQLQIVERDDTARRAATSPPMCSCPDGPRRWVRGCCAT
jgi:carbon monoxide dehydrogenase subunit G